MAENFTKTLLIESCFIVPGLQARALENPRYLNLKERHYWQLLRFSLDSLMEDPSPRSVHNILEFSKAFQK